MPRGMTALEIVFAVFILIVVTFVVIRIFTGVVSPSTLPNIQEFKDAYNYQREMQKCESLCNRFVEGNCQDYAAAAAYCVQKVSLSIDGNSIPAERGHYGMIANLPYCEDGLYCFHISDCTCGSVKLDAKTCLIYLDTYYKEVAGFDDATTKKLICSDAGIKYGSCCPQAITCDPKQWSVKPKGFDPNAYPDIDATHWWKNAGYESYCAGGPSKVGLSLDCKAGTGEITCKWSGCQLSSAVHTIEVAGVANTRQTVGSESGSITFTGIPAGSKTVVLVCTDSTPDIQTFTVVVG